MRALKREPNSLFTEVKWVKVYGDKVAKYRHEYTAYPSMRSREEMPITKKRMEYVKELRRMKRR